MVEKPSYEELERLVQEFEDRTARHNQVEEALRESGRRLRTLLDFAPYPIVVFTLQGLVTYLNPAFTEIFGWTLEELQGKKIPYVPPGLEQEASNGIRKLFEERTLLRHETKRLTKQGRALDVIMRATLYVDAKDQPAGELVILRDITREKRIAQNNAVMLRISTALPQYPDLEELVDYICSEVMQIMNTEGAVVTLLDQERQEVLFLGAAYGDAATQKRIKGMRYPMDLLDQFVVPKGLETGEPIIVNDTSRISRSFPIRDEKLGYATRNFLQVTLRRSDRTIGTLCAINRKEGRFEKTDVEMMNMVAATVALSIENARATEDLKRAYRDLASLDRAKDKVFHHLSHELKTPVSVLSGSLKILMKKMAALPDETWKPALDRAWRNINRIMELQSKTEDIVQEREYKTHELLSRILDESGDVLETLLAQAFGEGPWIPKIREEMEGMFGPKAQRIEEIDLSAYVSKRLDAIESDFAHRRLTISRSLESAGFVYIPREILNKVFDGLVKNAVENTPDGGTIAVELQKKGDGSELLIADFGVGLTEENQGRIFEGFFTTQETMDYASKKPFDFNAGGRGMDLLRMKIFSERYGFEMDLKSTRCAFIADGIKTCPGDIAQCTFCRQEEDCHRSGGTTVAIFFPPVSDPGGVL